MSELDISTLLLSWITTYGAPMVAGILFLGALGLPLPGTLIVIASGAFVRQEFLNLYSAPLLGLLGTLGGDLCSYGIGRIAGSWVLGRFAGSPNWIKAREFLDRRGGMAIYLTRWLLTAMALPMNLIAGSSGYSLTKFFILDLCGEVTWILLYGTLGYAFGNQWELISDFVSKFTGFILGGLMLIAGIYLLVRAWKSVPRPVLDTQKAPGEL